MGKFLHRDLLTTEDYLLFAGIVGSPFRDPDLVIAPDGGDPYLYRWHLWHRQEKANSYFHIQVASDPERPLHDHPWDNFSVILSGGYDELYDPTPGQTQHLEHPSPPYIMRRLRVGDAVHRQAEEAHRLFLPECFRYSMSVFSTGPRRRNWGFWYRAGWEPNEKVLTDRDGKSIMREENRHG